MADINDTTPVPYSAFTAKQAYTVHNARAKVAGAMALLKKNSKWEGDDDLVSITFVLNDVMQELETVADVIGESDCDYTLKQQ